MLSPSIEHFFTECNGLFHRFSLPDSEFYFPIDPFNDILAFSAEPAGPIFSICRPPAIATRI